MSASRPDFERVVVLHPKGVRTGGPEALHQLVDSLRRQGVDAGLAPLPGTEEREPVAAYARYDAPEVALADEPGTAVVVPESSAGVAASFRRATRFIWWLSADNASVFLADWRVRDPWRAVSDTRPPLRNGESIDVGAMRASFHLTQSAYAWSYLFTRLGVDGTMLSDYTRAERFGTPAGPDARERIVSYNDAKCGAIVRHLAPLLPGVEFCPIRDASEDDVAELLGRSAIYLDLGYHPGKDRLPREAALAGALVVVARRGAGAYAADIPVPESHKVRADDAMVVRAAQLLPRLLDDLAGELARQDGYREAVRQEKRIFDAQVRAVFVDGEYGRPPASTTTGR